MTTTEQRVDPAHYTYRVSWSAEDGEYVATCLELPSLSWLAKTSTKALSGVQNVAADVVADLYASGEEVPPPLAERTYSGRLNVRVSPELHRELVRLAAEHGMSLNRFLSDRLARS